MATSLWNLLGTYKIVIPILQRDYAQGRQTGKVPLIRERFLNALRSAVEVNNGPLELDFVYGYTRDNQKDSAKSMKSFIPLDGQQRLTTLFLLHWFIAVKENHIDHAKNILSKFTYETRHSSRVFCEKLVEFNPDSLELPISETIINQSWFFTAWKNDPTINSMLTMLNAIQDKFKGVENIWPLLTLENPRIVFHLLPMEKLGLPDDLYIKMNSRGKELSEFEHFKSRFSEILNVEHAIVFNNNIDQAWSDLFWDLYRDTEDIDIAKKVDSSFLKFFKYITDILIAKHNIYTENNSDEFITFQQIYMNTENVDFLFNCLNIFHSTYKEKPSFFDSVFYTDTEKFSEEKTRLFFQKASTDLFKKCAENYDPAQRQNPFSIGEQLLLFACIVHLTQKTSDFNTRIRTLRNLIANSSDTVRNENMQSLLNTVSGVIMSNSIDTDSKFNKTQAKEEEIKQEFTALNRSLKTTIFKIEDHPLLQGCIAIFKLEPRLDNYTAAFQNLYTAGVHYESISRALLTLGDYTQDWGNFTQFGINDNTWRELLTPSNYKKGFHKTHDVLHALLSQLIQNPKTTLEIIISTYLDEFKNEIDKPKDWKYYFIKYPTFRRNEDGFYFWKSDDKQYESIMMRRTTLGGFNWSPFLFTLKEKYTTQLNLDNYGAPLLLTKGNETLKITNLNQGYLLEAADDNSKRLLNDVRNISLLDTKNILLISQNKDGIDIEDRIEKGAALISNIISF